MTPVWWLLALVVVQRIAELAYARRNTARLRAEGAVEHGAGHYPLFILLHAAWLLAIAVFVPSERPPNVPLLVMFLLLQLFRIWILVSLGRYWTTRILTVPSAPLVRRGPYRWLRHPNYMLVVCEIALLPLVFGAWWIAIAFTIANAMLLAWRIRIEDAAIAERRSIGA